MDIKQEILSRAPTKATQLALALLILFEGATFVLVPVLNPITLELDPKNLSWLTVCISLVLALLASMFVNVHLTNRLRSVSQWVEKQNWSPSNEKET
jgi:hypothetical protein